METWRYYGDMILLDLHKILIDFLLKVQGGFSYGDLERNLTIFSLY